jgi:DNA-binding NtrC family response regulator
MTINKECAVVASLDVIERDHILTALRLFDHDRTRTAKALGISTRTLHRKLREYHRRGYINEWRMPRSAPIAKKNRDFGAHDA